MEKHPIGDMMSVTMQKIKEMVDVNTIIGTPIQVQENLTLIPVSKVSFGFASGGSEFQGKRADPVNPFGGGGGAGVKIDPVAFIVIKDGNTRILNVAASEGSILDRLADMAPELLDKLTGAIGKLQAKKAEKAEATAGEPAAAASVQEPETPAV